MVAAVDFDLGSNNLLGFSIALLLSPLLSILSPLLARALKVGHKLKTRTVKQPEVAELERGDDQQSEE